MGSSSRLKLERKADAIKVRNGPALDYWEVDPNWDGSTFRSAAQAQRPVRSASIPHEMQVQSGRQACVRLVTIEGDMLQRELDA